LANYSPAAGNPDLLILLKKNEIVIILIFSSKARLWIIAKGTIFLFLNGGNKLGVLRDIRFLDFSILIERPKILSRKLKKWHIMAPETQFI